MPRATVLHTGPVGRAGKLARSLRSSLVARRCRETRGREKTVTPAGRLGRDQEASPSPAERRRATPSGAGNERARRNVGARAARCFHALSFAPVATTVALTRVRARVRA